MTRPALLTLIVLAILFVCATDALAVTDPHKALVMEQIQIRERIEAKRRHLRKLRQRYREWRQWRKADVRRRVHRWAVHELKLGVYEYGYNVVPRYDVYGWEWCATFCAEMVEQGEPGHPLPANPNSTSSWKKTINERRRGFRPVYIRLNVKPGDIVCFRAHMGIVHRTDKHGFWSIEGNCTDRVAKRFHYWWEADVFGRVLPTRIPERFDGLR